MLLASPPRAFPPRDVVVVLMVFRLEPPPCPIDIESDADWALEFEFDVVVCACPLMAANANTVAHATLIFSLFIRYSGLGLPPDLTTDHFPGFSVAYFFASPNCFQPLPNSLHESTQ
ncbi:hypothetical protein WT08_04160 [Burkholderia sp. MSMB1552]|nr:hypothetical protein WS76_20520 [Burkholderia humptydooensis]KVN16657.1 hypothetical protein WT08_04160 [Burkholderia sp. MSMB1552]KWZ51059.1 hypothetical protein WS92_27470 [Burkholderia sp. MSMB1588]